LTREQAETFAREWVDAWNAHDLDRILAHWREDARFRSPFVATVMGREDTTIVGKQQLREYWSHGLAAFPDLHFELHTVCVGSDSLVLGYRNHRGQEAAEMIVLDHEGLAREGIAHYAPADGY
jgi:hypothetical protein